MFHRSTKLDCLTFPTLKSIVGRRLFYDNIHLFSMVLLITTDLVLNTMLVTYNSGIQDMKEKITRTKRITINFPPFSLTEN